jgi:TonB-linked SusC/RagA family outer membrane protein
MKKLFLFMATLLVMVGIASAQAPSSVRGKVTFDEDGSPLPGVSIFVKGSTVGTVTNSEGDFALNGVPSNATILVFSCIGMETMEVPVKAVVNVVMTADTEALEEAIVTIAYGAAKKSTLTGAIASVNAEQITNRPTSSVTSALEGTVSGVQINSTIGSPGNDPHVYIRGVGTINGSSSVLYVLDGVAFGGNISDLNPADIESITVLKDAASAALYGNRASNGVILITTKKGTQGRLTLNLDMKQGVYQRGIPEYRLANAKQWMEIYWQAVKNEQIENGMTEKEASEYASANIIPDKVWINVFDKPYNKLFNEDGTMVEDAQISSNFVDDLDWYKLGLRNGYRGEYNLSGSGATEKSDYYFSAGYLKEDGYVTNSGFERFSARAAANIRPVKWLKLGLNLNATHQNFSNTMVTKMVLVAIRICSCTPVTSLPFIRLIFTTMILRLTTMVSTSWMATVPSSGMVAVTLTRMAV